MWRMRMLFIFGIGFTLSAQTINLKGTVTNSSGKPISGAVVTLPSHDLTANTNAQGAFTLTGGGTLVMNLTPVLPSIEKISVKNRIVLLNLTKPSRVKIELFDMRGNLLGRVVDHAASSGAYRFDLMNHPLAAKMTIVSVAVGDHFSTFRCLPLNNGSRAVAASIAMTPIGGRLAKMQAAIDSLSVTAANYLSKVVPISSYEETVTVSLDTSGLGKFSFFLTSLKGLQELSGNTNGFGGDLRFGKTGQGAGLLGADSICQCLAEKSMPGSKAKIWRAFLSAKAGADGQQVNAIDRIGEGPWYDRLGRLFANNKSELINDRPKNADPEIINDFPNEWGVENHRPDPNQPALDNHLTITGSNQQGLLYDHERDAAENEGDMIVPGYYAEHAENPTCDDWTSTTALSSPRCGFSWPQEDMSKYGIPTKINWISNWSLRGCQPGVDIKVDPNRPAGTSGSSSIGNGGGYGGFYCFALTP